MIIREDQFKEVEYLQESLKLLTDVHKALKKVHNHLADRVNTKHEESKKLLGMLSEEKNK
jgi:hypothetical protein